MDMGRGYIALEALARMPCISRRFLHNITLYFRWLGSRVVSVLDSGTEGPGFKSQPQLATVHTHRASVHQAAKLVAALLIVARVNAGLAASNGSLPPGL